MNARMNLCAALLPCCLSLTTYAAEAVVDERFDCLIEPMVTIEVGSPSQGVIQSVAVDRGEQISKGQVLAQLESTVELASVAQARARAEMVGEVLAREADLRLARNNLDRVRELFERKMVSVQNRDEALVEYRVAEMVLQQARERKMLATHELKWSEQVLNRRTITSPIDGVVVQQRAFAGEFVYENPILTIAKINPLRVEVVLPARMFGQIAAGDTAIVTPEIDIDGAHPAEVTVVDPIIDSSSSTFGVRLEIDNQDLRIPAGQRCEIAFTEAVSTDYPDQVAAHRISGN